MIDLPSKLQDLEIPTENPFMNDKLGRAHYAAVIRSIVEAYAYENFVLAINGEWGTGKTTFVKMWKAYMERLNYRTIYFNAWETDYISDPLIALIGEMKDVIKTTDHYDNICSKAGRILVNGAFGLANGFIKSQTGASLDFLKGAMDETQTILTEDIKNFTSQKASIEEFRKLLSEYIAEDKEEKKIPLIFIVDELDRCNPHYAVKVLERIKHLCDVPNVVFVLPICKSQLECSIKGFYGCQNLDASNYLRRFINLEYELPAPDLEEFCNFIYDYYKFEDYFQKSKERFRGYNDNKTIFTESVMRLFNRTKTDLRTIDRIYAHSRLVAQIDNGKYAGEMDVIFLLCYIKMLHQQLYNKMRSHRYSMQELLSVIEGIFPKPLMNAESCDNLDNHGFTYTIAKILYAYNIGDRGDYEKDIFPKTPDDKLKLHCRVFTESKLLEALVYVDKNGGYRSPAMKNILSEIDMLQNLR